MLKPWYAKRLVLLAIVWCATVTPVWAADGVRESIPARTTEETKIPFKKAEPSTGGLVMRVIGGLLVTMVLGIGALYVIKRYVPSVHGRLSPTGGRIQILEVRRLTTKSTLFLVECDGARLLLGQSGDSLVVLQRHQLAPTSAPHESA